MAFTAADMIVHVGADVAGAVQGMNQVGASVNKGTAGIGRASLLMGGLAAGIVGGFGFAISSASNFEGAMSDVSASLGVSGKALDGLREVAIAIGRDTAFSASEGAQAIEELGKAGVSVENIMSGAGMAAAQLASATGEDIPNSANVMANAMTIFSISGDKAGATADTMTAALNESSLTLTDFAQGMASAGTMAAAAGLTFEQTSGALALLSANGMSGADAGTSLRNMLTQMAGPTEEAQAWFNKLGISMQEGIDSGDLLGYTAEKLKVGMADMGEAERLAALKTMFGADAQRAANILFGEGAEGVKNMTDRMKAHGQAGEAAAKRLGGLRGALEQMRGSMETAAILFGSMLTPALTRVSAGFTKFLNWIIKLPRPMKAIIGVVAGVVGGIAAMAAGVGLLAGAAGPLTIGLGAIASALGLILVPALLVAGAVLALKLAWDNNFHGMRDTVTSVVDTVSNALSTLGDFLGKVANGGTIARSAMEGIPGPLQNIAAVIGLVVRGFKDFYDTISNGQGLTESFRKLWESLGSDAMVSNLSRIGDQIKEAFANIDWGGIAGTITSGLASLGSQGLEITLDTAVKIAGWLWDHKDDIWGGIKSLVGWTASTFSDAISATVNGALALGGMLADAASNFGGWVWKELKKNWDGMVNIGTITLQAIIGWAGDLLNASQNFGGWAWNKIKAGWDGTIRAGTFLVDASLQMKDGQAKSDSFTQSLWSGIVGSIGRLGNLAAQVGTAVANQITSLNWATWITSDSFHIGQSFGTAIHNAIVGAVEIGIQLVSGLIDLLSGADWSQVAIAVGVAIAAAITAIPTAVAAIGTAITSMTLGAIAGIVFGDSDFSSVATKVETGVSNAFTAAGSWASMLVTKGEEIITGLGTGMGNAWPGIVGAITGAIAWILLAFKDAPNFLLRAGQDIISGLATGMSNTWNKVVTAITGAITWILLQFKDSKVLLQWAGSNIISGLATGMGLSWSKVTQAISGAITWILNQFANAAGWLLQAGRDVIGGLISGLEEKIPGLQSVIDRVAGLFDRIKNLGHSPWPMMIEAGNDAMDGLILGTSQRLPELANVLDQTADLYRRDFTNQLQDVSQWWKAGSDRPALSGEPAGASRFTSPTGATGATIHYVDQRTYTVKVDDLPEVQKAADFFADLQRDRELVYGAR